MKQKLFQFLFPEKHRQITRLQEDVENLQKSLSERDEELREIVINPDSPRSQTIRFYIGWTYQSERNTFFSERNDTVTAGGLQFEPLEASPTELAAIERLKQTPINFFSEEDIAP